jgi:predicted ribosomally synthesized peptide with SipW-like signal peptide
MKSKKLLIAVATLAMIGAASVGPAMAYFTDSEYAKGKVEVSLGDSTLTPHEKVTGYDKKVVIENTGKYDVYVRVKAYAGSTVGLKATTTAGWTLDNDGYYQFDYVVEAGDSTDPIVFTVTPPADSEFQDDFNVIIYEEATRAEYKEDGTPVGPNWKLKIGDKHGTNTVVTEQPVEVEPVADQPVNDNVGGDNDDE